MGFILFLHLKHICCLSLSNFLCLWNSICWVENCSSFCFWCLPSGGWSWSWGLWRLLGRRDWCLLLVGEAGSCPSGGQGHVKGCVYRCLWAQCGFRYPVCWWVDLCSYPADCFGSGVPALEPVTYWVGPDFDDKMATSRRAHTNQYSLGLCHQSPCPLSEPQLTPTSPGDPLWLVGRSSPGSYGVTTLCWVPVYVRSCVCPPRWRLCFPSPVGLLHWSPTGLQSQVLSGFLILMLDP